MPHFPSGCPVIPEHAILPGSRGRDWFRVHGNWPLTAGNIEAIQNGQTILILVRHFQYRDDNNVINIPGSIVNTIQLNKNTVEPTMRENTRVESAYDP